MSCILVAVLRLLLLALARPAALFVSLIPASALPAAERPGSAPPATSAVGEAAPRRPAPPASASRHTSPPGVRRDPDGRIGWPRLRLPLPEALKPLISHQDSASLFCLLSKPVYFRHAVSLCGFAPASLSASESAGFRAESARRGTFYPLRTPASL